MGFLGFRVEGFGFRALALNPYWVRIWLLVILVHGRYSSRTDTGPGKLGFGTSPESPTGRSRKWQGNAISPDGKGPFSSQGAEMLKAYRN